MDNQWSLFFCLYAALQKNIRSHKTLVSAALQTHPVPPFWKYREARKIFLDAPQTVAFELTWIEPDEEALVGFLCHVKHVKYVVTAVFSFSFHFTCFLVSFKDSYDCVHAGVFLGRAGSVIECRSFVICGKQRGRREKRSVQQDVAGRLAWRTSLELPERGVR